MTDKNKKTKSPKPAPAAKGPRRHKGGRPHLSRAAETDPRTLTRLVDAPTIFGMERKAKLRRRWGLRVLGGQGARVERGGKKA